MYQKYDNVLIRDYGLYFDKFLTTIVKNGNHTGIYPDVALLLYKLSTQAGTGGVLEFGSGMSTLVLAHAAKKTGCNLVSIENLPKWFGITSQSLNDLGLSEYVDYTCTNDSIDGCPVLNRSQAVVFVDGIICGAVNGTGTRMASCLHYWEHVKDAVLVFDDAQTKSYDIEGWLEVNRPTGTSYLFNPTGRGDRQILISFTDENKHYLDVVKSCEL